jgi:hypothetical protein
MQLFVVSIEALLLQATQVGSGDVRDVHHLGEDIILPMATALY